MGRGRRYNPRTDAAKLLKCPTSFPDKYQCKLTFATSGVVAITAAGTTILGFHTQRAPIIGGTAQMQGWDQLANMYLNWRPLAMGIRINGGLVSNNANNASVTMRGYWSQYSSYLGNDLMVIQNRFTKSVPITQNSGYGVLQSYSNLRNVHGMSKQEWFSDDSTIAAIDAEPVKVTRYWIHVVAPALSSDCTFQYDLLGEMWIEFSSPRILVDA